jgi:hypothetical protein
MKSILFFCALSVMLLSQSCKENTAPQQEETKVENAPVEDQQPNPSTGGHDYAFLTDKLFHYKAANIVGKDPNDNPYAGHWIDMDPDGTYKAGILKDQTHTGRWDYNHEAKVLLLRPDDKKFKISEWNVMHNNDMVVLVGTQTYGNNATQIQLVRKTELP